MQADDVRLYGRDYSAREWTPEQFDEYERLNPHERPIQFLRRYIGYPNNSKCISAYNGMFRRHWEAGRPVGLFHQIGYTDMEGGYDRGRQHALTAKADAESDRVGWQGQSHIVACMDRFYAKQGYRTLTAKDLSEYMRGFRSVLGDRTGFYGFYDSMRDAINGEWASYYVQCGARSAHIPGIHEWQENNYQPTINGVGTDILELYASPEYAFGIGGPGGGGGLREELGMGDFLIRDPADGECSVVTISATTQSRAVIPNTEVLGVFEEIMQTKARNISTFSAKYLAIEPGSDPVDEQAIIAGVNAGLIPMVLKAIQDLDLGGMPFERQVEAVQEALRRGVGE